MSFFGQKNYTDIQGINGRYRIADIGCFLTAFCNLEQRFGKDIDPPSLNRLFVQRGIYIDVDDGVRDDLGWPSITAYDGQVHVITTGGPGWPETNNAIVKFAYKSPRTGAATTHFCLVADPRAHTIVDSWDGVIRSPGYYGEPVAWATYDNVVPQPVVIPPPPVAPASTATTGQVVILQKADTIAGIALRYNLSAQDILEHNGLTWDDARHLPIGYQVRLPIAKAAAPATNGYKIELLPAPKIMHVSKAGGTEKWAFGNVQKWSDFVSNGHVPANTNVTIVAVATVIIGKETAAYYMEAVNVGDYATTGHVTSAIGFNWHDLADGSYEPPKPTATPVVAEPIPAPTPAPEPPKDPTEPTPPQATTPPTGIVTTQTNPSAPDSYKTTYKAFAKPQLFITDVALICKEYDGRRTDHRLDKNVNVSVAGTFIVAQTLLGRPTGAVKAGVWYGVPMDKLLNYNDIYSTKTTLAEKLAMHSAISIGERAIVALSWVRATALKLESFVIKGNK